MSARINRYGIAEYGVRLASTALVRDEQLHRELDPDRVFERYLRKMLGAVDREVERQLQQSRYVDWETFALGDVTREQELDSYRLTMQMLAYPSPPLTELAIRMAPMLRDGMVLQTENVILIGTRPLTELEAAGREARLAVRRGLADVLEWLGRPVMNEPTGAQLLAVIRRRGVRTS